MKAKTIYVCTSCGAESPVWAGKCSQCGAWDSLEEKAVLPRGKAAQSQATQPNTGAVAKRLRTVRVDADERLASPFPAWDAVLGGGLVRDSVTILTARPGAGKSTLLLQMAAAYARTGKRVLYASGEESASQIRARADRLFQEVPEDIWLLATSDFEEVEYVAHQTSADIVILDSVQTYRVEEITGRAGSPGQTVAVVDRVLQLCKNSEKPRAALLIGHMTKADEMAGLRTLEHMVDTVLRLEGDSHEELRMLRSTKNRFGATGEIGVFEMTHRGLLPVDDPSDYFVTRREQEAVGTARTVLLEGNRVLTVEIESLTSKSFTPYPMRISESVGRDRMNTLLSVLEERGGMRLLDRNIILKTTGGIRVPEPAADLAIIMSVASSLRNQPLPSDVVFLAEVGLTGELKRTVKSQQRIRELDRLGYRAVIVGASEKKLRAERLEILRFSTLADVLRRQIPATNTKNDKKRENSSQI